MYKAMGYPSGMLLNIVSSLLFFSINGIFSHAYKIIP